jgi:hypothetical protein
MNKETSLKIKLIPTLNRAITLISYPTGKPVHFTIIHNKQNTALQFQVDSSVPFIQKGEVTVSMYRNLENCKFCQTFLMVESQKNDKYDYRCKFSGINRSFEREMYQFTRERLDFQMNTNGGGNKSNNYLMIMGWRIFGLEDDLLFFFIQRKCYNTVTRTNVIRTAGLQFATKRGTESLEKYYNQSLNSIKKVSKVPFLDFKDEVGDEKKVIKMNLDEVDLD